MRAKLTNLNHCAVPFLSRAAVNLSWYDSTYSYDRHVFVASSKWIHRQSFTPYNQSEYMDKLKSIEILPMKQHFLKYDLLLFFKMIHELVPITMPHEIAKFNPRTRSNTKNLYKYQLHENIANAKRFISNSFFVRTMTQ